MAGFNPVIQILQLFPIFSLNWGQGYTFNYQMVRKHEALGCGLFEITVQVSGRASSPDARTDNTYFSAFL